MAHGVAQGPTAEVDRLGGPALQDSVFPVRVLVVISRGVEEDPQGVRGNGWPIGPRPRGGREGLRPAFGPIGITPLAPGADLVQTGQHFIAAVFVAANRDVPVEVGAVDPLGRQPRRRKALLAVDVRNYWRRRRSRRLRGRDVCRKSRVKPLSLPWCGAFRSVTSGTTPCPRKYANSCTSESPLRNALNEPKRSTSPTDRLLCSTASIGGRGQHFELGAPQADRPGFGGEIGDVGPLLERGK